MAVLPPPEPRPEPFVSGSLTDASICALFEGAADFKARRIQTPGGEIGLYFIDGLVSGSEISEFVLRPLVERLGALPPEKQMAQALSGVVYNAVALQVETLEDAVRTLVNGFAVALFGEGMAVAF